MNAAAGPPLAFPWQAAMTVGLGLLRLSPRDFWSMTPREFDCAARALFGPPAEPPDRTVFSDLMARFPDRKEG